MAGIDSDVSYVISNWFPGISSANSPSSASIRGAWGSEGCVNMVASYNRPLPLDEINYVNTALSDLFRSGSQTMALY